MGKRILSFVLGALVLVNVIFGSQGMVFAASAPPDGQVTDVQGSWAGSQISKWLDKGLISGYADQTFKPNASISRAEFASIVNKVFGFKEQAQVGFNDVKPEKWYYSVIGAAKSAGYISGFGDNSFKPEAAVSRQEAAKMLYILLQLNGTSSDSAITTFKDYSTVPAWSKLYLNEIVSKGYMNGYPDQTLRPLQTITRAEAVVMLDKVTGTLVMDKGNFGGTEATKVAGNLTVNTPGVTLKNVSITGDLLLTAGIGTGDITLDQVTVSGRTVVAGGGENSIHLLDSQLNEMLVNKQPGSVRIVAEGSTRITKTLVKSAAKLEGASKETSFNSVELDLPELNGSADLSGTFSNVTLKHKASVNVLEKSEIGALEITTEAAFSTLNIAEGSVLKQLTLNAAATVKGKGTISKAFINTGGATFEQDIKDYVLAKDVKATVNGKVIAAETDPNKQLNALPPAAGGGSAGGGGGGGGGGSSPGPAPQPQPGAVELPEVTGVFIVEDQLYARFEETGNYSQVQWDLLKLDSEAEYATTYKKTEGLVGIYRLTGGALSPARYIATVYNEEYYDFLPSLLLTKTLNNGFYYPAVYYTGVLNIQLRINQDGITNNANQSSAGVAAPLADGDIASVYYGDLLLLKAKWDGAGKRWVYQELSSLLKAPGQVSAISASRSDINVKWTEVRGAEYYTIYTSSTAEGTYSPLKDSSGADIQVKETTYTHSGLAPHTTVYYKVMASANGTRSALSQYTTATTVANENMPLNFNVTDSIQDPDKPIIYATDKQNKRLAVINYETRQTSYIPFDLPPEDITYADGKLYVALLKAEHSYYIYDEQQKGAIAVVDAATLKVDHIYDINLDPYSIAADRQGNIYVSSGSGQWTKIRSYNGKTFTSIGESLIRQKSPILMHPTLNKLYSVDTDVSPADIKTFAVSNGQFISNYDSPYHGDYPLSANNHLSPDGKYLFNGGGTVFLTTDNPFEDMNFVYKMDDYFDDMVFDLEQDRMYTVKDHAINVYEYSTFEKVKSIALDGTGKRVFNGGNQLLALTTLGEQTVLEFVDKPSAGEVPPVNGQGIYLGGTVTDAVYNPANNLVYAIDQTFRRLVVVDSSSRAVIQKITLPYKPAGLTLSEDGTKLYIVNKDVNVLVTELSLDDYSVVRHLTYANERDYGDTSDRHIYSRSGRLYVVLGNWMPTLLVFNQATFQPAPGNETINSVGEMVFSGDSTSFYYWHQDGWSAGSASSDVYKYAIHEDGSFTKADESNLGYPDFYRDPLDTPTLLVESLGMIIVKNKAFNKDNLQEIKGTFPEPIYAVNPVNNTALGKTGIYDLATFQKIGSVELSGAQHIFYDNKGTLYYVVNNTLFIN